MDSTGRLIQLRNEIGSALGRGEFPENQLREFRFLWGSTPDSEKDGLSFTLKSIEDLVARLRREQALASGSGKVQYVDITYQRPDCDLSDDCACR